MKYKSICLQNRQTYSPRKQTGCLEHGEKWGVTANGYGVSFWSDENILKLW